MAVEHIAGLAFGGQQPHSPEEHVEQPNVLILHSMKVPALTHCNKCTMTVLSGFYTGFFRGHPPPGKFEKTVLCGGF